jgi:hypothetical protein
VCNRCRIWETAEYTMLRCTNYEKGVTIQWLACCKPGRPPRSG